MTFVITRGCCNDASCVAVCPVQCIRPRPGDPDFTSTEQLYIDPATCIDCGACVPECPIEAIYSEWDLPEHLAIDGEINTAYFVDRPVVPAAPPSPVRRALPGSQPALRVAIVGSGPSACYAASILSDVKGVSVTMLERTAAPFGLVKSGVAPDHAMTKTVADRFTRILLRPRVATYFNVEIGREVSVEELLDFHHAVLWAGGAPDDRKLGIEGEDLVGVHAARSFMAWCNGVDTTESFDLRGERAIVIGNGNVALDVARLLSRPSPDLAVLDIDEHVRAALTESRVREVVVVGRSGVDHAAFTFGELASLDQMPGATVTATAVELEAPTGNRKRELLLGAIGRDVVGSVIRFRFGLRPLAIEGAGRVEAVVFAKSDGTTERIPASLVLRAIGHRGASVAGLPFDDATGTLPSHAGRVTDPTSAEAIPGLYCSGWIKRGPRGTIGTNKSDAEETVDSILEDLAAGRLRAPAGSPEDFGALLGDRVSTLIDKQAWIRADRAERRSRNSAGVFVTASRPAP